MNDIKTYFQVEGWEIEAVRGFAAVKEEGVRGKCKALSFIKLPSERKWRSLSCLWRNIKIVVLCETWFQGLLGGRPPAIASKNSQSRTIGIYWIAKPPNRQNFQIWDFLGSSGPMVPVLPIFLRKIGKDRSPKTGSGPVQDQTEMVGV